MITISVPGGMLSHGGLSGWYVSALCLSVEGVSGQAKIVKLVCGPRRRVMRSEEYGAGM